MIVKLMGFLDLFTALIILLFHFRLINNPLVFSLAIYMIFKAVIFFGDAFSMIDGAVGLYMLFMMVLPVGIITAIAIIFLSIKGFTSLAS